MDGLHCLGTDDEIGFDPGALLQAAGGVAQYGVSAYEQEEKEKKLKADESKSLSDVLAADATASLAMAKADVSSQTKGPSAAIDATAAQMAMAAQDRAGANLTPAVQQKRADAADKSLAAAVASAQAKPTDGYLKALVRAWTATANKAHSGAISSSDKSLLKLGGGESWWTKRVLGPVPGYGVVLGGAGILGVLGYAVKRVFFK